MAVISQIPALARARPTTMEKPMKKLYAKPTLVANGDAVPETMTGARPGSELAQPVLKFNMTQSSVGFYL